MDKKTQVQECFLKSALKSGGRDLNSIRESMRKHGVRDVLMIYIDDMAHLILKVSRLFFF